MKKIERLAFELDGISKDCFPFSPNELASIMELLSLLPFDDAKKLRDTINNSLSSNKNSNKQRLQSCIREIKRTLKTTRIAKKYYKSRSFGLVTFEDGINKIEIKAKEVLKSPISISGLKHALSVADDNFFSEFSKNFMSGKFDFGKGNASESIKNLVRARRLAVCYGSIVAKIDLVLGILDALDKNKSLFSSVISLLNRFRDKYSGRVVNLNNMLGLATKNTLFESMTSDQRNTYQSLVALASEFAKLSLSGDCNVDSNVIRQKIEAFKGKLSPDLYRAAISDGFSSSFDSYSKSGNDTPVTHLSIKS